MYGFFKIVANEGINVIRLFLSYSFIVRRSFSPFSCTELFVFTDQGNKRIRLFLYLIFGLNLRLKFLHFTALSLLTFREETLR